MKFDDRFYEGEVRDGFYVRPMMKRAWAAQMEILSEIDKLCRKHDIRWFADWGTLLGAIRHHGFIPWDDDIDIAMKREDLELFKRYAAEELPNDLKIVDTYTNPTFKNLVTRVINSFAIDWNDEFLEKYHGCPYVSGIDIFSLDYVTENDNELKVQIQLLTAANLLAYEWDNANITIEEKMECLEQLKKITQIEIQEDLPIQQQLFQLSDRICGLYNANDGRKIAHMCDFAVDSNACVPAECYRDIIEMPFENITLPVPSGYDEILRMLYGDDYMQPKQIFDYHEYPYFKEQEERLRNFFELNGQEFPAKFAE